MLIHDRLTLDGSRRTTADGYLAANAHVARTGIQTYAGGEVGRSDVPSVRVFRPEGEVFDRASLATLANKPITIGHPAEMVTSANWRQHAAGMVGGEILRDGDRIAVPILLTDAAAIRALDGGMRELSAGYDCDLDFTPGRTPAGDAYDAVQRRIRFNHVAVVERGRAGSSVRIGDSAPPPQRTLAMMTNDEIRTMRDSVRGMPLADAMQLPIYDDVRGVSYGGGSYAQYCAIRDGAVVTRRPITDEVAQGVVARATMVKDLGSAWLGDRAPAQVASDPITAHGQMVQHLGDAWRGGR